MSSFLIMLRISQFWSASTTSVICSGLSRLSLDSEKEDSIAIVDVRRED
jgi:hypothetical protein